MKGGENRIITEIKSRKGGIEKQENYVSYGIHLSIIDEEKIWTINLD
jgi:hypothetical protein